MSPRLPPCSRRWPRRWATPSASATARSRACSGEFLACWLVKGRQMFAVVLQCESAMWRACSGELSGRAGSLLGLIRLGGGGDSCSPALASAVCQSCRDSPPVLTMPWASRAPADLCTLSKAPSSDHSLRTVALRADQNGGQNAPSLRLAHLLSGTAALQADQGGGRGQGQEVRRCSAARRDRGHGRQGGRRAGG